MRPLPSSSLITDRVSVIIANWNGVEDLRHFLPTLAAQSYSNIETIVVDNGSTDESETVARGFQVRWLPLQKNHGLAFALNRGAEVSHGEFFLFLNNDMRLSPDFISRMLEKIREDQNIFAVDAKQLSWEGSRPVHSAVFLSRRSSVPGGTRLAGGLYIRQREGSPGDVLMASAANMLVRASMFLDLDGFDERMFIGYEDVDLCWRAWIRGWRSVFAPEARSWHRVEQSARSSEGRRNRFRGTLGGELIFASKLLPLGCAAKSWGKALLGGLGDIAKLRFVGLMDRLQVLSRVIRHLPAIFRERRRLFLHSPLDPKGTLISLQSLGGEAVHHQLTSSIPLDSGKKLTTSFYAGLMSVAERFRRRQILRACLRPIAKTLLPPHARIWMPVRSGPAAGVRLRVNPRFSADLLRGACEESVQRTMTKHLKPGMIVFDLGANIGFFSLLAARLVGPQGKVLAFEPDPEVCQRLREHVRENRAPNIEVIEGAGWKESGRSDLHRSDPLASPDRGLGSLIPGRAPGGERFQVRTYALDDCLSKWPMPDFIKCDVEGAEVEVFHGAQKLLRLKRPAILCEMHSEENEARLLKEFENLGYACDRLDSTHVLALPDLPARPPGSEKSPLEHGTPHVRRC